MKTFVKFILLALLGLSLWACKKEEAVEPEPEPEEMTVPDLEVQIEVTGAISRSIDFTLPGNVTDTRAMNGAYSSTTGLLSINAMENLVWNLAIIHSGTGGIETGTWAFNQSQQDILSYVDQEAGMGFNSVSGELSITKSELFQDVGSTVGAGDTYFIDGSIDATLVDENNPPNTINIQGTFSGVGMGLL